MNNETWLKNVKPFFPGAFIYGTEELILERKTNTYFSLVDVKSDLNFDCKMLEWLSRAAYKGTTLYWQRWFLRGLTSYFRQPWSREDMGLIYQKLGNGVNRDLCERFIVSRFDLDVLRKGAPKV